jgi:hypothetical protein
MRFFAAAAASKPDIESRSDANWRIAIEQAAALEGLLLGRCYSLCCTPVSRPNGIPGKSGEIGTPYFGKRWISTGKGISTA